MTHPCTGPLHGIRVIELGSLIAGPFAAKTLADFGAEVIKIEAPGTGEPLRGWRIPAGGGESVWWHVQSRDKCSVALDLRQSEGQELVRRLASEADVVIENFRPGTLEQWGLDKALSTLAEASVLADKVFTCFDRFCSNKGRGTG